MTEAAAPAVRDPLARLKDELSSLAGGARARLKGTSVETVANRLKAELPGAVETRVDALLDRAGLVRKAKIVTAGGVAGDVVAPPAVVVDERPSSVGQVA